ncbi:hypothetical protein KSP39_PZI006883 [Platanthera zijinensis]|uniref:Uncharacterized protein n=1 Tax=Platanthera zijinensis TaxID=2320716 RepID=A0AAP0BPG5_9ASPA
MVAQHQIEGAATGALGKVPANPIVRGSARLTVRRRAGVTAGECKGVPGITQARAGASKRSSGLMRLRSSLTEDGIDLWRRKYGLSVDLEFTPVGVYRLMGLIFFFREHGGRLTLDLFRDWCDVRTDGGERVEA